MKGKPDTVFQVTLEYVRAPTIERLGEGEDWQRRYYGFHLESRHSSREVTLGDIATDVTHQLERLYGLTDSVPNITVQITVSE